MEREDYIMVSRVFKIRLEDLNVMEENGLTIIPL